MLYLSYMGGASLIMHELSNFVSNYDYDTMEQVDPLVLNLRDRKWYISPVGAYWKEFHDKILRKHTRGIPYTPVGLLFDHHHGYIYSSYGKGSDRCLALIPFADADYMGKAIVYTLYPSPGGDEKSKLSPNPLTGDIFDAITNTSPLSNLIHYPVIVTSGNVDIDEAFAETLMQYVEEGGTLFINTSQQIAHFPDTFLGVKVADDKGTGSSWMSLLDDAAVQEGEDFSFQNVIPATAKVLVVEPDFGRPLVTENVYGDKGGKVILTTPDYLVVLKEKSGENHFRRLGKIRWRGWRELTVPLASLLTRPDRPWKRYYGTDEPRERTVAHWGGNDNQFLEPPLTGIAIGLSDVFDKFKGKGVIYLGELRIAEDSGEESEAPAHRVFDEGKDEGRRDRSPLALVAHWAFNEGDGETLRDSSPYERTGKMGECTWKEGVKGNCLELDGMKSYIVAGCGGIEAEFTVEGWFNTYGKGWTQWIIEASDGGQKVGFDVYVDRENLVARVSRRDKGQYYLRVPVSLNTWHHFALTVRANEHIRLYLDGALKKEIKEPAGMCLGSTVHRIGHWRTTRMGDGEYRYLHGFCGMLDEIRIYVAIHRESVKSN